MQLEDQIILFDGACNLCNFWIRFVSRRDTKKQYTFLYLQSETGQHLLARYGIQKEIDSVVLIIDKQVFIESDAVLMIAKGLRFPWNLFPAVKVIPKKWRDNLYRWVAKNRYKWFGKQEYCDCELE